MKVILFSGDGKSHPHHPLSPNSQAMPPRAFVLCIPVSAGAFQGLIYIFVVSDPKEENEWEMAFIFCSFTISFYHFPKALQSSYFLIQDNLHNSKESPFLLFT